MKYEVVVVCYLVPTYLPSQTNGVTMEAQWVNIIITTIELINEQNRLLIKKSKSSSVFN